jgi:predicted Rossmann fold nucleotide-binding protein DprA/Smf involved in DNA uptake
MNKVWNMVQKIKGKNNKTNVHHLKDGRDTLTSEQDISNKLGQTLSKNSSTQNYHPEFQKFKKQKEKTKLNFKSKYLEEYNCPFSLDEMRKSLDVAPTISITSFSNIFRNRHSKLF